MIAPWNPATDRAFVLDSWLKGYKDSPLWSKCPLSVYQAQAVPLIHKILSRSHVLTSRPDPQDPFIHGYVVFERRQDVFVLHWAHVKGLWRRQGIFKELLAAAMGDEPSDCVYTFIRKPATKYFGRYGLRFDGRFLTQ